MSIYSIIRTVYSSNMILKIEQSILLTCMMSIPCMMQVYSDIVNLPGGLPRETPLQLLRQISTIKIGFQGQ